MSIAPSPQPHLRPPSRTGRLRRVSAPTVRYWLQTEVHVYAMAVAVSVLLAMVPFLIVMVSICDHVLRWHTATNAIYFALRDLFPDDMGSFIERNLRASVGRRPFQFVSLALLLFTANGIFVPLEVALNRIWGCAANRSYLRNQLVSLGLIFLCGGLFLLSITMTALNSRFIADMSATSEFLARLLSFATFKIAAVPVLMLMLFFVYWLLPNCKVPVKATLIASVWVGLALELVQDVNIALWPWFRLKMTAEYGPFAYSVTIVMYGFFAAMMVLAGAEWAARSSRPGPAAPIASAAGSG